MKIKYAAAFHKQLSTFDTSYSTIGKIYYIIYDGNYVIQSTAINVRNAISELEKQINPREYNLIGMKSKFPVFKKR